MTIGLGRLRLTPAVLWDLSLPELLLMLDGHRQQQHDDYFRTGTLVAAIYNVNRDTQKHGILSASDIFPFLPKGEEQIAGAAWTMEAYDGPEIEEEV